LDLVINGEPTNILSERHLLNCTNEGDFEPYNPVPQFKFTGISYDLSKVYFTSSGFNLSSRTNAWDDDLVYDLEANSMAHGEPEELLKIKKIEN